METSLVEEVIRAVAEAEGTEPAELEVTLQDHVDTDAVRQLVAHDGGAWELRFELPDHTVTIRSDDVILVDGSTVRTLT